MKAVDLLATAKLPILKVIDIEDVLTFYLYEKLDCRLSSVPIPSALAVLFAGDSEALRGNELLLYALLVGNKCVRFPSAESLFSASGYEKYHGGVCISCFKGRDDGVGSVRVVVKRHFQRRVEVHVGL